MNYSILRRFYPLWLLFMLTSQAGARLQHAIHVQTQPARAAILYHNSQKRMAMKPNMDIYVYRRSYTPGEHVLLRLSAFNVQHVKFFAYRLDLSTVVKSSKTLEKFGDALNSVKLTGQSPAAVWGYSLGKTYPDQWNERAVTVPKLPPGAYLIQIRAGGVEKRTWLAISGIALLAKRSRQELLILATEPNSGKPLSNIPLNLVDELGHRAQGGTGTDGTFRISTAGMKGNLWIHGADHGSPAFALTGEPPPPNAFTTYTFTDRPIYRPGHKVQYKAIVRQRFEAATPGGFTYRPYAGKSVVIEIRDATDALITRRVATTNHNGSLSGDFQLASEPTLGNWRLNLLIGDYRAYNTFRVEAYRKPEMMLSVKFDKTHYLGGTVIPAAIDAQYYFGQPVSHAPVHYSITFEGEGSDAEPPYQGQGMTDAKGQLHLDIKTQRLPSDRSLTVQATVTDLSRRSISASGDTHVEAGLFRLTLDTDRSVYKPGERVAVLVHTMDYDNHPVAVKVRVRLIESKEDRQRRPYEEVTSHDTSTDAAGNGVVYFSSLRPGDLKLKAVAFDSDNDKITADGGIWVAGEDYADYDYPTLALVAAHDSYNPGQTATVMLNTSLVGRPFVPASEGVPAQPAHPDAWALVTIEGERLGRHEVVHLTHRTTLLRIPLTDNEFPSISVNVAIIQDRQLYEQDLRLHVIRTEQRLTVKITPDKQKYRPGETAVYTITTRDSHGRPAPAEVSLGVVDASIYAIQPETAPDMEQVFYGGQEVRVQTDFSFAAQYSGGGFQTIPRQAASAAGDMRVRKLFADTAYWNPVVETNSNGSAQVSLTMPDNLTTWRATAHGITDQTSVGSATQETVSAMPLLVRLETPRFYVQGDEAIISAVVHNYTGSDRTVHAQIEVQGATLSGDARRILLIDSGSEMRVDWTAKITDAPNVRFLVTADGGSDAKDAAELALPVQPDGLKTVTANAEILSDAIAQDRINLADLPAGASITLTLSPSIASATFDALDYLTSYPYGSAEQTTSALLPNIAVDRALHRLHSSRPVRPDLAQWVNLSLQKLYRDQHINDGGWNWWEFDQTDGDMTAYVLYGLAQARQAGYMVDEQRLLRGAHALEQMLGDEQELSRRADWLLSIAYILPKDAKKPLDKLFKQHDHLDTYGQGSLCLALAQTRDAGAMQMARTIAQELSAKAAIHGRSAYWSATEGGYSWRSDDVTVTAHTLRALLTAAPGDPVISGAVRWLLANRDGTAWGSTKASAEAVLALTQYLEQNRELEPNFAAHITLDGRNLKDLPVTPLSVFDAPITVTLTPEEIKGHTILTIDKKGAGVLYVSRTVSWIIPPGQTKAESHGISIRRNFRITAEDPSLADVIASQSEVDVQVEITADADYRYVILEDPIPAGCEVIGNSGEDGSYPLDYTETTAGYTRQETRDNRVVFFFGTLPKGLTKLTYRLQAETPGKYRILPSIAALTYFPEVRGSSNLATLHIGE